MNEIIIIGAGGFGREVLWLIERINDVQAIWSVKGYVDDKLPAGFTVDGYPVLGGTEELRVYPKKTAVVCAIGNSKIRRRVIEAVKNNDHLYFPNLIDPSALMSRRVRLGKGAIICASSILTVDITIADFVIVNLDCVVGHDVTLQSFVTLYPSVNISGNVCIQEEAEIGTGAQIIQGKHVFKGAIVGAGAVVVDDIPSECTAVGCPAKPIKFHEEL